jgi:hypothetical protein
MIWVAQEASTMADWKLPMQQTLLIFVLHQIRFLCRQPYYHLLRRLLLALNYAVEKG